MGQFARIFLLLSILSAYLTGCTAIKCYVCAPVPEIGETCGDAKDTSLDECGATTDSCHVLFIQQVNGATEITRNCGQFRGAFQAGKNECKDFVLVNHRSAKLCNCMSDGCNIQVVNPQEAMAKPVTASPSSDNSKISKPDGHTNKLPIYNPALATDGTTKSGAQVLTTNFYLVMIAVVVFLGQHL